jgi:hypothetical protein
MTEMATKLGLYNGALFLLKATRLDTVSDAREERYTLDEVYDSVLGYCLEQGNWKFATRTVAIEHSEDLEPSFGYSYAFERDTDFVRLIAISASGNFFPPLEDFADEASAWHANCDPLYASYVSDGASYGADLSLWPRTYERAVEHELAVRIAPHITTMGGDGMDRLIRDSTRAMANAKMKDARAGPIKRPPPGRLVQSRMNVLDSWRSDSQ